MRDIKFSPTFFKEVWGDVPSPRWRGSAPSSPAAAGEILFAPTDQEGSVNLPVED